MRVKSVPLRGDGSSDHTRVSDSSDFDSAVPQHRISLRSFNGVQFSAQQLQENKQVQFIADTRLLETSETGVLDTLWSDGYGFRQNICMALLNVG